MWRTLLVLCVLLPSLIGCSDDDDGGLDPPPPPTPVQITSDPADDRQPRWSPDGTTLAFESLRSGNWDIWTIPADGGEATRLTVSDADEFTPRWSPDGTQLAYSSYAGGSWNIWVVPAAGGDPTQLTDDPADYQFRSGGEGKIGIAVWEGASGNVGGRKHWSQWIAFKVESPPNLAMGGS